jgi:PAS domain S-box-containing protein
LLAMAFLLFQHGETQRQRTAFDATTSDVVTTAQGTLGDALQVAQAVNDALAPLQRADAAALGRVAPWWLERSPALQAVGFSARVSREQLAGFEAEVRAEGQAAFRVFDRPEGQARAREDRDVVAIRAIEPLQGNAAALGVNALSVPAAREAILHAAASGTHAATRTFRLTQSVLPNARGVVVYKALPGLATGDAGAPAGAWRGVVFVTVDLDRVLTQALQRHGAEGLSWCLLEQGVRAAGALSGAAGFGPGCEAADRRHRHRAMLTLADRSWALQLVDAPLSGTSPLATNSWLLSVMGLAATALLGLLLLTVTGRTQRVEAAVSERTRALSLEVRERRLAEQALRDSEQRLRGMLDNLPLGVVFLDGQAQMLAINPGMAQLLAREQDACRGLTLTDRVPPEDKALVEAACTELAAGRRSRMLLRLALLRDDGSRVSVRATLAGLRDDTHPGGRLVGVLEDISEHLRLQEIETARDAAEAASRAKSEFVSRMSHELRTPLNAVLGFAQLLAMDQRPALAEHQAGWAAQMQRAGWHLLDLINETLDLSRIESGHIELNLQALDLRAAAESAVTLMTPAAQARRVRIQLQPAPGRCFVQADETRVKQILSNLLSNAIKYNREGGQVALSLGTDAAGSVLLEVTDSGLGMNEQQLAALFQPYNRLGRERGSIEGTGIGLVISRRLAQLMGGSIEASSVEGQGSRFVLRLPRTAGEATPPLPAEGTASLAPAALSRHRVHYIEDNETNVLLMRAMLARRPDTELTVSLRGAEGLAAVRRASPDVLLLDMHLPDADGMDLLRQLKADDATAAIPVIVVSADATPGRVEQALTLGAVRYVTKPLDMHQLLKALDQVLEETEARWR